MQLSNQDMKRTANSLPISHNSIAPLCKGYMGNWRSPRAAGCGNDFAVAHDSVVVASRKLPHGLKRLAWTGLLVVSMFMFGTFSVYAATATNTFQVTATVPNECIVSATDLAFGSYSVTVGAAVDASTSLSVTCSGGTGYDVSLDAGTGSGATVAVRKMTSGANTLDYSLYQDSGYTQVWGETIGSDTVSGTGNGSAQAITIYGRIAASQAATAGSYSDTVTATVTF